MEPNRSIELRTEHEPHGWYVLHDEEDTYAWGFKRGPIMRCEHCNWTGWVSAAGLNVNA